MAQAALAAQVIGTVVSTVGAIKQGNAERAMANSQAAQLEQRAGQDRARAQLAAAEERRQADIVSSRARALVAAGSGDTTDVGSQDILSGIGSEGEYRSLTQLYEGEERAKSNQYQASVARTEGKVKKQASMFAAASNLMGGASSIYDKYAPAGGKKDVWGQPYGTPWKNPDL